MKLSSYKVNPKHRGKPTQRASVWTVSEWTEILLFGRAKYKKWFKGDILWAIEVENHQIAKIGRDLKCDLYIAKYICDSNSDWHGYPVFPKDHDIPPETVLEAWRQEEIINKADKRRIQQGKFYK